MQKTLCLKPHGLSNPWVNVITARPPRTLNCCHIHPPRRNHVLMHYKLRDHIGHKMCQRVDKVTFTDLKKIVPQWVIEHWSPTIWESTINTRALRTPDRCYNYMKNFEKKDGNDIIAKISLEFRRLDRIFHNFQIKCCRGSPYDTRVFS